MTSVRDKNKINQLNVKTNNFDDRSVGKLNAALGLSIINILLVLVALTVGGWALYLILNDENKVSLFMKGISESNLLATNGEYNELYSYYTQANNKTLQKYSGHYSVTVSNASNIDFIVTDENNNNITGNIVKPSGAIPLPTIINFQAQSNVSQLNLKYKTSQQDVSLLRIDIKLD